MGMEVVRAVVNVVEGWASEEAVVVVFEEREGWEGGRRREAQPK